MAYLSAIDVFQDLAQEDLAQIDRMTRMDTAQKGQIIYAPERTGELLFLLKRGRVQLYTLSPDGRRLIIAILEPQTFFGEMSLLGQSMVSTFAEAMEDSTLCVMTRDDVERLLLNKPAVALRILEVLGQRLQEAESRLQETVFKSVPARIAAFLLRLSSEKEGYEVTLSHQEIADVLGVYRETVTNALDEMKTAGVVDIGRRKVVVRKVEALRQRAQG
ncbi:MAG: Crp/Fnr family transcriptional regulator [Chloroflexi bacterium]|nr:Crp/Fnr family transcriptional regulator [Chloroflexota bacterium]